MTSGTEMQEEKKRRGSHQDYFSEASLAIKRLLLERRMTYADLAASLRARGYDETELSVSHKIRRGRYQMRFFFECMEALSVKKAELQVPDWAETRDIKPLPETEGADAPREA